MTDIIELDQNPLVVPQANLVVAAEIDQQIATAHRYPRSIVKFRQRVQSMVTLSEAIAGECIYVLPRGGKNIEGPSARFAEIVANAWGNSRAGARVINEGTEFVTAQGVFHDLEANVAITYEVQRRITDSKGRRFNVDMIGVTANAACSIALRNAILKGVPKAFWSEMYEGARQTVLGNVTTLPDRRAKAMASLQQFGVRPEQVFAKLGVAGIEDLMQEHLLTLRGMMTALREGDLTVEDAFAIATDGEAERKRPQPKAPDAQPAQASAQAPAQAAEAPTSAAPAVVVDDKPKRAPKPAAPPVEPSAEARKHLATDDEKAYLRKQCEGLSLQLQDVMHEAGITDWNALTADGFVAMKEALNALR